MHGFQLQITHVALVLLTCVSALVVKHRMMKMMTGIREMTRDKAALQLNTYW